MFNSLKDKFVSNSQYKDITELYNIIDITDDCILIQKLSGIEKLYVFKIQPVTLLNVSEDIGKNIVTVYTEFLRSMEVDFQIYIENCKINVDTFLKNISCDSSNVNKNKLAKVYKSNLDDLLNKNNIYINYYYIVVTTKDDISYISKNIYNLSKIGVSADKIEGKDNLEKFIYAKLNKEDNIC